MKLKLIRGTLFLTLIFLISVSLISGLELTVSTGNNDGSSAIGMVYGAETIDTIDQKIKVNADEGTLSNHIYGTGSLPLSYLSISNTKGNAKVYRSVSGKPGVTSWNYDWNTFTPYSSSAGYGVGAQLWLNVNNAYTIRGGSSSGGSGVGSAAAEFSVNSDPNYGATSSLVNYYTSSTAFTNEVRAYQSASASKGGQISGTLRASDTSSVSDHEGTANTYIGCSTPSGIGTSSLNNFYSSGARTKTSATANLGFGSASGLSVAVFLNAVKQGGDVARGSATRINDYTGIVTFSEFSGSSQSTNTYARADIYGLKANLPLGSMSVNLAASTYPFSGGLIGSCSVSTTVGGKANLYKYPYDSVNWKSYAYASKSNGVIKASQSAYGQSYPYILNGVPFSSRFVSRAEASKSGYTTTRKETVGINNAIKVGSYAQVLSSGAPYVSQGYLS